jgi:hypothetical protein
MLFNLQVTGVTLAGLKVRCHKALICLLLTECGGLAVTSYTCGARSTSAMSDQY